MEKIKCEECGEILEVTMKTCPKCGCPVSAIKQAVIQENIEVSKPKTKKSFMPYIGIILGIIILALGVVVSKKEVNADSHSANNYNVDTMKFGGDFYTEIYGASDTIVDELNDINTGVASISESVVEIINAIYFSVSMIIYAIGLAVIAVSCVHIKRKE